MIVIMGPGRCGTTFLIQMFTALGFDTAGRWEIFREERKEISRLGKKYPWPRVIKGTGALCQKLKKKADFYGWKLEHIYICYRQLEPMMNSRIARKSIPKSQRKKSPEEIREYFQGTIPRTLGHALHQAAFFDCPVTVVKFPRSATDMDYLCSIFEPYGCTREQILEACFRVADRTKIRFGG